MRAQTPAHICKQRVCMHLDNMYASIVLYIIVQHSTVFVSFKGERRRHVCVAISIHAKLIHTSTRTNRHIYV